METVKVSEILDLVKKIHKDAQTAIHYLEGRILIGEINHPSTFSPPKIVRKRRTKKEMELAPPRSRPQMDLEKEYQAERHRGIPEPIEPLPDGDAESTFYTKKKREKKGAEVE